MRTLSLHQPWASLLVHGLKMNETRGPRLLSFRPGPLLIHAAKRWTRQQAEFCAVEPFRAALDRCGYRRSAFDNKPPVGLPFGAVVGFVEVLAVVPSGNVKWVVGDDLYRGFDRYARSLVIGSWEKAFGDYTEGRAVLVCQGAKAFARPFPCQGRQSVFDVPSDVIGEYLAARGEPKLPTEG